MHVRVWKFRPPDSREDAFVAAYSANGGWARELEQVVGAEEFIGTFEELS